VAKLLKSSHEVPSLVRGGPSWQVERMLGFLAEDGLPTPMAAIVAAVFCWLPMAFLAGFDHRNWNLKLDQSFFADIGCYARFLVAIYILIITDRYTDQRLHRLLVGFEDTGIIARDVQSALFSLVYAGGELPYNDVPESFLLAIHVLGVKAWWAFRCSTF